MIRPNLASLWVIYDLYIFIKLLKEKDIKHLLKIIGFSILGVGIVFIPIILYLIINNAFMDFINIYILFNFKYAGSKEHTLLETMWHFISNTKGILIFVAIVYLGLIGYICKKKKEDKKLPTVITSLIFFIFTFYLVIMPQREYMHYLIPMLPTLIVPIVLALKYTKINKNIIKILIVLSFIFVCYMLHVKVKEWDDNWGYTVYLEQVSKYVQENTNKEDNVLQIGNEASVYLMSDREYKGKYSYQIPIAFYSEQIAKDLIDEIKSDLPKVIIDTWRDWKIKEDDTEIGVEFKKEINNILKDNYIKESNTIYVRKGENE